MAKLRKSPELQIGDLVRIKTGSPVMLVVDIEGKRCVLAWKAPDGAVYEEAWQRQCLHRVEGAH